LDFFLVNFFQTPGLVFATIGVNITSMGVMLWVLNRRLNGLPFLKWGKIFLILVIGALLAGVASWGSSFLWEEWLGNSNLILETGQLIFPSLIAVLIFFLIANWLKLPEVSLLKERIKNKFQR
ncbi:MAG: lipid II flippase MurJ, partial [Halothece sp.]